MPATSRVATTLSLCIKDDRTLSVICRELTPHPAAVRAAAPCQRPTVEALVVACAPMRCGWLAQVMYR